MRSVLVILHCESNTGYAIAPLEATFYRLALALCDNDPSRVHFAYPSMSRGRTETLPSDFNQYLVLDTSSTDETHLHRAAAYAANHRIDTVFGFDLPVRRPVYRHLRRAGVKAIVSYWGAPMSSLFGPIKLAVKRLDVFLSRSGPDHYIFESEGMRETAVRGRGISARKTSVVFLGVDTNRFRPDEADANYAHDLFQIPRERRIFFYAGHMEARKGVSVIMRAANVLAQRRASPDWHILLFGNQPGEEAPHMALLSKDAKQHVTFGGYRPDLDRLQRSCYSAIIASTGWDSFPRTGIEVQSSGLPLIASDLPGLRESVGEGTGFLFPPGDHSRLADIACDLLDQQAMRNEVSRQARQRALDCFSLGVQLSGLVHVLRSVGDHQGR